MLDVGCGMWDVGCEILVPHGNPVTALSSVVHDTDLSHPIRVERLFLSSSRRAIHLASRNTATPSVDRVVLEFHCTAVILVIALNSGVSATHIVRV